jgi:hypothetical protein
VVVLKRTVLFAGDAAQATDLLAADFRRGGLLWQKDGLDVGEDTALRDRYAGEELVQFLVVSDGELEVTGDYPRLLVVASRVTGELEDLGREVLHDGRQVDGRSGSDTFGVVSLSEKTVDSAYRKLKTSSAGSALRLSLDLSTFATSRHDAMRITSVRERRNKFRRI